jgi:ubiquinone/menaquinone biosynthesis C-methylase UbiE
MASAGRESRGTRTCPWWLMAFVDDRVRALVQPTAPVLASLVAPGHACLDVGCGMGYFTVPLARLVGPNGQVIAVDVQPRMLEGGARRLEREGLGDRVSLHLAAQSDWVRPEHYDFILAFWMLHEVPDRKGFLATLRQVLKPSGRFLLAEPRIHVGERLWKESLALADAVGFHAQETRPVRFSRAAVLR